VEEQLEGVTKVKMNLYKLVVLNTRLYPVITNIFLLACYTGDIMGFYSHINRSYLVIRSLFFKMCKWHLVLIFNMLIALIYESFYVNGYRISNGSIYMLLVLTLVIIIASIFYFKNGGRIKKINNKDTEKLH
jgi:hypothetical protein